MELIELLDDNNTLEISETTTVIEINEPDVVTLTVEESPSVEVIEIVASGIVYQGGGTGTITSVNGYTDAAIVLDADDVGAKPDTYVPTWSEITSKPAAYPPSAHGHTVGEITNLQTTLDAKQPLDATLTSLAAQTVTANQIIFASGADTFSVATLTAFARTLIDDADAITARATLGLNLVDNTSDASKPVSTATQTALNLKANLNSPTFTGTVSGISKGNVGLGNVDNTSDANKPVSTATQTALNAKADAAHTHTSSAITDLTATVQGIINTQLDIAGAPATLDTINELAAALGDDANFASTVTTSLAAKAPLASPTFTGTVSGITKSMVGLANVDNTADSAKAFTASQITSGTLALARIPTGTTSATVALGDHLHTGVYEPAFAAGTTAQYRRGDKTWQTLDKAAVGLASVDNTSDATKPVSTAQQNALNLKANLASPTFTGTVSGITAAMVGAATTSHSHAAADITSGVLNTARLGTGTADATTYLRGDGTWATVSGGITNPVSANIANAKLIFSETDPGTLNTGEVWIAPSDKVALSTQTLNAQTGTSYTPVLSDSQNRIVTLNNAAAITLTLPQDSAVAIGIGQSLLFVATGAGQVTVAAGTGATVVSRGNAMKSAGQYAVFQATKISANTWLLTGDLSA